MPCAGVNTGTPRLSPTARHPVDAFGEGGWEGGRVTELAESVADEVDVRAPIEIAYQQRVLLAAFPLAASGATVSASFATGATVSTSFAWFITAIVASCCASRRVPTRWRSTHR